MAKTQALLSSLTPDLAERARFELDGDVHRGWNFMGTRLKPGAPLEQMDETQKQAAYELLQAGLSADGYDKVRLIMATQDVMRELGRGPASRNSERFSLAIFGEPAPDQRWGLRVEGHHLSLSWTLVGDEIVSLTPASFSVIPQNIPVGELKGTRVLDLEETGARRLINDLTGNRKQTALISERTPGNVLAQAGREDRFGTPEGIAVADLGSAQRDLLWELIHRTTVDPWPAAIADAQATRVREGDPAAIHFAWAGSTGPGEMFYYRIQGDNLVLEFTSVFGDPEHLHAVYHDPERTLGRHRA